MARFLELGHGIRIGFVLFILVSVINPANSQPVDGTFSYQGRLDVSGFPANGPFDFEAVLFDSLTFGNQVGPILRLDDIDVTEGLVNGQPAAQLR